MQVYGINLCLEPVLENLDLRNGMVPLKMPLASHGISAEAVGVMWPKSQVAPHFDCLDLRNAVVPMMTLSASCDPGVCVNCLTWQNSNVAPHFDYLHETNAVLSLTAHGLDAGPSDIKWTKNSWSTLFQSSWPRECNGAIENNISIMWYQCQHQGCHLTKKSYCISFWSTWPNKCNGAIDDTVGIMWPLHHSL